MTSDKELFDRAVAVRAQAHAGYSGFKVGAAILDADGAIWIGCNVENAAYPLGACAEAGAISAMVAGGGRRIRRIAIVGGRDELEKCPPCGGCRQRIAEFATPETRVVLFESSGEPCEFEIGALLPLSFALRDGGQ